MKLIFTKSYENSIKKIKKYTKEYNNLLDILDILESAESFDILIKLPILQLYNFERLKYQFNEFYSFNLSRNGGLIRLIIKPKHNKVEVYIVYISFDHYKDFINKKVIIDDK